MPHRPVHCGNVRWARDGSWDHGREGGRRQGKRDDQAPSARHAPSVGPYHVTSCASRYHVTQLVTE